jgi:hypothetical protein
MTSTRGSVKAKVRELVDDPNGSYVTDGFLDPLIQEEYEIAASKLASTLGTFDDYIVEVPGVAPGTADLSAQQQPGGVLEQLVTPQRLQWKYAGTLPKFYRPLRGPVNQLTDRDPDNWMREWQWLHNIIMLSTCLVAVDIRVRGEFDPPVLTDDSSPILMHPRLGAFLGFKVAALAAKVRGNPDWVQQYSEDAIDAEDEIMAQIVRSSQRTIQRVGRMSGRRRGRI